MRNKTSYTPLIDVVREWARVRFDRLPEEYKILMRQARALLDGSFSGVLSGEIVATSEILFTSRLFEKYVAGEFMRHLAGTEFELKQQSRGSYLCRTSDGQPTFELIPDILVRRKKQAVVVIDTKWKKLSVEKRGLGVSPADIYQGLAYALHFGCNRFTLIFPNISSKSGKSLFAKTLSTNLHGKDYTIDIIGIPMLASVSDGCRAAIKILI